MSTIEATVPSPVREARDGGTAKRFGRRAARTLPGLVLAIATAAFLFLALGPRFLGYETSTMLTGSMAPLINPGDVVVSVRTPTSALRVGDIITYRIPVQDQRVETHRIIDVTHSASGATLIRTKGDANSGADPWTAVITDDAVYTTAAVIPHLGDVIRTLRSPVIRSILMFGAPSIFVAIALLSIWRRPAPASPGRPGTREKE